MKKYVINLKHREDRLFNFRNKNFRSLEREYEVFPAVNGKDISWHNIKQEGLCTQRDWIDPFKNQKLNKGELGCFLSHVGVWQQILDSGEPGIVFEDDAEINHELWDEDGYKVLFDEDPTLDFLYLQHNENREDMAQPVDGNDNLVKPFYPYNMTAYIITPRAIQKMITHGVASRIKPIDETLPEMIQIGVVNALALKTDHVRQAHRDRLPSDIEIEPGNGEDIFIDFDTHVLTVGTDRKRMTKLHDSAQHYGLPNIVNLGKCVDWYDPMTGRGGGKKLKLLKDHLETLDEYDHVLFTDSYDVFYGDYLERIIHKFLGFNTRVLFSAESVCWPRAEWSDEFPETEHPYRYLNSGTLIGRVKELKEMLHTFDENIHDDDQEFMQKQFLSNAWDCKLDTEGYIFQCHEPEITLLDNGQLYNPRTNCCPSIYHGNGGEHAEETLNNIFNAHIPQSPTIFLPKYNRIHHMEKDMLVIDFMRASQCERLIELADANGQWAPLPEDKFPAYEIRMKELQLWDELVAHWEQNIYPVIHKYWHPIEMYGMRDAFVMRYSADTQKSLPLHHDASLVTGSVKLNDDYIGADLVFPRQGISNIDVPVGSCILFPGMVTHGHQCTELTSGVKYSLTMWSSRYPGDII